MLEQLKWNSQVMSGFVLKDQLGKLGLREQGKGPRVSHRLQLSEHYQDNSFIFIKCYHTVCATCHPFGPT